MLTGFPAAYFAIKAFSETDMSEDPKKLDVPTLILHGDVDQIVPISNAYRTLRFFVASWAITPRPNRSIWKHSQSG
jgi:pimeloyl-ACP methyl ester carboxylesterase